MCSSTSAATTWSKLASGNGNLRQVAAHRDVAHAGGDLLGLVHRGEGRSDGGDLAGVVVERDDVGAAAHRGIGVATGAAAQVEDALALLDPSRSKSTVSMRRSPHAWWRWRRRSTARWRPRSPAR